MSGSFSGRDAQAQSAPTDSIPKIQVQKLGNYRGQYLTTYYAVGTRPFLSTDSSQVNLSEIKQASTTPITADFVSLPAVDLVKQGFRPGYNLIVFVISPEANYSWINTDGSATVGLTTTPNHRASLIRSYSKSEIESLITGQGLQNGLILTLQ